MDLSDEVAIVTGAGRGIGRTIATTFARAGADVVAAARSTDELDSTVAAARNLGVEAVAVPTDLREAAEIEALVETAVDRLGVPTVLVNNAGVNLAAAPAAQTLEEIDEMLAVNFRAVFLLTVAVGEAIRASARDHGRVVNLGSLSGPRGNPHRTVYGGTKTGLFGLSRGLAAEYAADGVTVNTVSPVTTYVERVEAVLEAGDSHALDRIPLGRGAYPEEVADACLFFASEHASFITGQELRVDGGASLVAPHRKW